MRSHEASTAPVRIEGASELPVRVLVAMHLREAARLAPLLEREVNVNYLSYFIDMAAEVVEGPISSVCENGNHREGGRSDVGR